jgi:shikimate kinase
MRYFLIGFMGSGKSYWGKKWGEASDLTFLDLDDEIEQSSGQSIRSMFEKNGELTFRKLERKILHQLFLRDNYILSCGGGTPCFFDNMKKMNQKGITIYLKTPADILASRLRQEKQARPLISDMSDDMLIPFIEQKLSERRHYYSQSFYHFDTEYLSNENFERIIRRHGR